MKRALVISAGGAKGSYAGGIVEYYIRNGRSYDSLYGSSIGSLIIPFAATNNYNQLKTAFTSITMDDIFSINPFKIKKQANGIYHYDINYWNIFKNIVINKKPSMGDTTILRTHTIPKFFSETNYIELLNQGKELTIMVSNISTGELEKKCLKDYTYEQFCDWLWASTCAPPFMSVPEINGCHYTDGGVLSQAPIKQAILDKCDEIDVIILDKQQSDWAIEHIRNAIQYQLKLLLLMMNKIKDHQIDMGYLTQFARKKVTINFHYLTRRLTNNALIFDAELMNEWWEEGYEYAESNQYVSYIIDGRNNTYELIEKDKSI